MAVLKWKKRGLACFYDYWPHLLASVGPRCSVRVAPDFRREDISTWIVVVKVVVGCEAADIGVWPPQEVVSL